MRQKKINPEIMYEDTEIIVCVKPAGVPVQTSRAGETDLTSALKNYRAKKGEEPYIGLIHRLDQPVRGIMVFAKTREAAAALSRQVSQRQITKEYLAVVCSPADPKSLPAADRSPADTGPTGPRFSRRLPPSGQLHDYLLRDGKTNTSRVVPAKTPGAREALLSYEVLQACPETGHSLIKIRLHTGRHHQIRVQFAHAGFPLYADTKYGQPLPKGAYCPVALCSCRIEFTHPGNGNKMEFSLGDDCLNDLLSQAAPPTV